MPQSASGGRADGTGTDEAPAEPGAQSHTPVRAAGTAGSATAAAPSPGQDSATAGVGRARLRLSFSAPSWVDVRDADGRRLYAGNGQANSVRTVAGDAPMKVYLGFASGVQLQVNNRVVAIGPQFIAGDVARFEAGADGVLRRDAHAVTSVSPRPRG
jgi:cytoskeleton protein RodZ